MLKADFLVPLRHFDVEADIEVSNEILVLVGPSGSGKTTILRCLAGLKKPSRGTIRINNRIVYSGQDRINLPSRERKVGYVFQEYALFPHMTVKKNVMYGLSRETRKSKPHMVEEFLDMMGIHHLHDRYPRQISGGEKQRVALARALVTEPEIMLLDEPLSALDQEIRSELQQELKKIQRQWKIPFVLVTHDMNEAEILGDQIIKINQGKLTVLKQP
ncbi:MAG: ATP-binding cassette domain-containing protein [Peptococcaceae bacterium]|nr:ATP-binding cassette domain-containing protein [Peptococcaceae bacterium]